MNESAIFWGGVTSLIIATIATLAVCIHYSTGKKLEMVQSSKSPLNNSASPTKKQPPAQISSSSSKKGGGATTTKVKSTKLQNGHIIGELEFPKAMKSVSACTLPPCLDKQNSEKSSTTAALGALDEMMNEILDAKKKTLAYWRVVGVDNKIVQALQEFCNEGDYILSDDDNDEHRIDDLTSKTLVLFNRLNLIMSNQERAVRFLPGHSSICMKSSRTDFCTKMNRTSLRMSSLGELEGFSEEEDREVVAIVFGGKEANPAQSLSEELVETLSTACEHVYTVSRSDVKTKNKKTTHFMNKHLCDAGEKGVQGFVEVMEDCIKNHIEKREQKPVLAIYFTLGFHKGNDVFNANLRAAENFAEALKKCFPVVNDVTPDKKSGVMNTIGSRGDIKWKVIVTGTDATRPSTTKDTIAEWDGKLTTSPGSDQSDKDIEVEKLEKKVPLIVPSYHIHKYNFVYAMSKIGQFYIIGDAVGNLAISKPMFEEQQKNREVNLSETVKKITSFIKGNGESFVYDEKAEKNFPMEDLNKISSDWSKVVLPMISTHLAVATHLSILYTPLHCRSWVVASVKSAKDDNDKYDGSVRAHIVSQIVRRLANAISIDMGTRLHTVHGYIDNSSKSIH